MQNWPAVLLALLILAGPAQAEDDVAGLPFPDPQCAKPDLGSIKVPKLTEAHGGYDYSGPVGSYNSKVTAYNRAAEAYNSCIHAYIDSANLETRKIQDQANSDIRRITDKANALMGAIHAKVDRAISEANDFARAQETSTGALGAAPADRPLRHQ